LRSGNKETSELPQPVAEFFVQVVAKRMRWALTSHSPTEQFTQSEF
jgi:hypothetical protein